MKHVYDTGKVKIGLAYEPPRRYDASHDMERLQVSLLKQYGYISKREFIKALLVAAASISAAYGALVYFS